MSTQAPGCEATQRLCRARVQEHVEIALTGLGNDLFLLEVLVFFCFSLAARPFSLCINDSDTGAYRRLETSTESSFTILNEHGSQAWGTEPKTNNFPEKLQKS